MSDEEPEIESQVPLSSEQVELSPDDTPAKSVPSSADPAPAPAPSLASKAINWTFLKSTAFYAVVVGAASMTLLDPSFATNQWYVNLGKFLGLFAAGFWTTRSLDRTVDTFAGKK